MTTCRVRAVCLSTALALALPCTAADLGPANRWLDWENNHALMGDAMTACNVSPALAMEWDQRQQRLAQALARTGLNWPEGWYADLRGIYRDTRHATAPCQTAPLVGYLSFSVWQPGRLKVQAGRARPQRPPPAGEGSGPTRSVAIHLNDRQGTTEIDWLKDATGPRMTVGQQTGTHLGHPVWGEKWMLVSPPNRPPPFVPAPLERVVKIWVAAQNADIAATVEARKQAEAAKDKATAEMFTKLIDVNRVRIEKVRRLLDGPPAQLSGPVYLGGSDEVQAQPGLGAEQVWMDNPAAFDPKLPRTAIQLLAVDLTELSIEPPAGVRAVANGLIRQFIERTDWRAMAAEALK